MSDFADLIPLLEQISKLLSSLAETQRAVAAAVRADDIAALSEQMKSQQALSLSLRGVDQKRAKLQADLGIEHILLRDLAANVPPAYQQQIRTLAIEVASQYEMVQAASHVARDLLECGLYEVEQNLIKRGVDPKLSAMEHSAPAPKPSTSRATLHTDFRA